MKPIRGRKVQVRNVIITISKHPDKDEIIVDPPSVIVKSIETLTFEISDANGFEKGTEVAVTFAEEYRLGGTEVRRRGRAGRGPFRRREGEASNPERGVFRFTDARRFDCGEIDDQPEEGEGHRVWKYDVSWTGLPDLDPRVKIERGG